MAHTPRPWTLFVRTEKQGACDRGLWIVGDIERSTKTVVDTGALDAFPLSDDDRALIQASPTMASALAFVLKYAAMQETKGTPLPGQLVGAVRAALEEAGVDWQAIKSA